MRVPIVLLDRVIAVANEQHTSTTAVMLQCVEHWLPVMEEEWGLLPAPGTVSKRQKIRRALEGGG